MVTEKQLSRVLHNLILNLTLLGETKLQKIDTCKYFTLFLFMFFFLQWHTKIKTFTNMALITATQSTPELH